MIWIRRETEKGTVQYICPHCHDYHEFREDFGERTFNENYIFCRRCGAKNGTGTPPIIPQHSSEPLTLEELREMNGEPAWWDDGEGSCWGIISVATNGRWAGIPFFRGRWKQANFEYDIKSRGMTLYRRPPEGEEK